MTALWQALRQRSRCCTLGKLGDLQQIGRGFASNSLAAIKDLRERSGAPISEVKSALTEADWDIDNAFQLLRKKGLAAAQKKSSRHAAEGLIGLAKGEGVGALVEVNSETDFVARNDQFRSLVSSIAQAALTQDAHGQRGPSDLDVDALGSSAATGPGRINAAIAELAGTVRENIRIRRAVRLDAPKGAVASYLHISPAAGLGRIGSLVAIEGKDGPLPSSSIPDVMAVGAKLAMHAVAARPLYLDRSGVPEEAILAEKDVLREQAAKTGKPSNIIEKMIVGRLNKFYEDTCFLEQRYVVDDALKVKDVLKSLAKEIGVELEITAFSRLQVGEGLEEEGKKDFAAEVADTLQSAA